MIEPSKRELTPPPYIELRKYIAARSDKKWFSPSMHTIQQKFTALLSEEQLSEANKADLQSRAVEIALEPESLSGFRKACSIAKNLFASGFTVWKDSATIREEILSSLKNQGIDTDAFAEKIKTAKVERDLKELNALITSHEKDWISPSLYTLSKKLTKISENPDIDKNRLTPFATRIFLKPTSLSVFQKACSVAKTFFSSKGSSSMDAMAIRTSILETLKTNQVPFEIKGNTITMEFTKPLSKIQGNHKNSIRADLSREATLTMINKSGEQTLYKAPISDEELDKLEGTLGDLLEFAHSGLGSIFKEPITKKPSTLIIDYDSKKKDQSITINLETNTITMTYSAIVKDEEVEISPCTVEGTLVLSEDRTTAECTTKITLQS